MAKHKMSPIDAVALVDAIDSGDGTDAAAELNRLLDAGADLKLAAARAEKTWENRPYADELGTLLRLLDRYPPADWSARIDALFLRLSKGKTVEEKQKAAKLLMAIGGADRWAAPLPKLHVPDLWPRLWVFEKSPHRAIAQEIRAGIQWGLRACPDRALAEDFVIAKKLTDAAEQWAWIGEDTRGLMDRIFKAKLESRNKASAFTIVYELQHGRADAALKLFNDLGQGDHSYQAQNLAVYGTRLQPGATVIEWIGGILDGDIIAARQKAAEGACRRAEEGQDIGPILPNLGRVLDTTTRTGEGGQALWWSAAALAVATKHLPLRKKAALAELTARVEGKAVAREGAGYGLGMAAALAHDWVELAKLLGHADAKVCAGAILGLHNAGGHMPEPLQERKQLMQPAYALVSKLTKDPRKDVAAAADDLIKRL